jgi:hypothetical protein
MLVAARMVGDGDELPLARRRCGSTLSSQKLKAYKCAIELVAVATAEGSTSLKELPKRIVQGIFAIARGSAMACAAVIDVVHVRRPC